MTARLRIKNKAPPGMFVTALFFIFGATILPGAPHAADAPMIFFKNIADVPLMPGLQELDEESLIFDKPEGRIVESTATGNTLDPAALWSFYDHLLPSFGWIKTGPGIYVRDGEQLKIEPKQEAGAWQVHVRVTPRD